MNGLFITTYSQLRLGFQHDPIESELAYHSQSVGSHVAVQTTSGLDSKKLNINIIWRSLPYYHKYEIVSAGLPLACDALWARYTPTRSVKEGLGVCLSFNPAKPTGSIGLKLRSLLIKVTQAYCRFNLFIVSWWQLFVWYHYRKIRN